MRGRLIADFAHGQAAKGVHDGIVLGRQQATVPFPVGIVCWSVLWVKARGMWVQGEQNP